MQESSHMSAKIKKDSTNELPMYDIEEALKLVTTIREKGLETHPLPEVAKGCGYANPTSTPFYRRLAAARLFSFLNAPKAELTKIAQDYLKPDTDDGKQVALTQAIMGIKIYADIVNQHIGRRLNTELIANKLEKDAALSITAACAKVCAATFAASLKFAGFIAADGTVVIPSRMPSAPDTQARGEQPEKAKTNGATSNELEPDEESQVQTLFLDGKRKRKITIKAPFSVTREELERIRAWLGFQLIVEEPSVPSPSE